MYVCVCVRTVAEAGYRTSILLAVDALATVSLAPQVAWLVGETALLGGTDGLGAARALRVGQLGARLIRMARLARLLLRLRHIHSRSHAPDADSSEHQQVAALVERGGVGLGFGEKLQDAAFHITVATVPPNPRLSVGKTEGW